MVSLPSELFTSPWTLLLETGGFCHDSQILKAKGAIANDFPSCFTFLPCFEACFSVADLFHQSGTSYLIIKQIPLQSMTVKLDVPENLGSSISSKSPFSNSRSL